MSLSGKHILITRPEPENELSYKYFSSLGAKVSCLPMMSITPLEQPEQKAHIQSQIFDLDLYDKVIFVSKNAVRCGIEWIDHCWPQLPIDIEWIGIGEGTVNLLNQQAGYLGIKAKTPANKLGSYTSETLLAQDNLQNVNGQKILILRGEGGRTKLAAGLSDRGAMVNSLALYKREKIPYSLEQVSIAETADIICITSVEGLENFMETLAALQKSWFHKTMITPSDRVAQTAKSLGWQQVINAQGADDKNLHNAITQL